MDYEAFINASFFLQGKADQFTIKSPGDRKQILMSILGLEVWETYKETAKAQRRLAEQEQAQMDGQIQEIERELAEEDGRKAALAALEGQLAQAEALRRAREDVLASAQKSPPRWPSNSAWSKPCMPNGRKPGRPWKATSPF